jgi:hypothetical protein
MINQKICKILKILSLLVLACHCFACQNLSQSSKSTEPTKTPAKENKKMTQDIISILQKHDRTVLKNTTQFPAGVTSEIERKLATLDPEARELAIEFVVIQDSENAGRFILNMTNDQDVNVATLAVESISKVVTKPKAGEILEAIPKRDDPFIRGKLYLEVGKRSDDYVLDGLRKVCAKEGDEEAKLEALAAMTKAGGKPEKARFIEAVKTTEPDDALKMQELMVYIGDASVAKGMISWLGNEEGVMRIGSDRQNMMARMCDVAVWTAILLKVKLPFQATSIKVFSESEIRETGKVLNLFT